MKYRNVLLNNTKLLILVTHKNGVLIIPVPTVHFPSNVAKRIMNEVNCWRCSHQTPTEPKGYATLLRANESGFIARPRWQKSIITNLWCSSDGNLDVPYHQLVNPVVVEKE